MNNREIAQQLIAKGHFAVSEEWLANQLDSLLGDQSNQDVDRLKDKISDLEREKNELKKKLDDADKLLVEEQKKNDELVSKSQVQTETESEGGMPGPRPARRGL